MLNSKTVADGSAYAPVEARSVTNQRLVSALRQLPLHHHHLALGANMGEFAGWRMPIWYQGTVAEHKAVRTSAGVFDVSHLSRIWVNGPTAAATLASFTTRDPSRLEAGASVYALVCDNSGGILEDLLIYRLLEQRFLIIGNAANAELLHTLVAEACASSGASWEDAATGTVLLAVQGPLALRLLVSILGEQAQTVAPHHCAELEVNDARYFLSRTGYTGEDGFEVMASAPAGEKLFQELMAAGCPPCGLAARDSLRLEAALPLHGADIDQSTLPWEAGLGWAVELNHEFPGRAALTATKDTVQRRLTCLASDGEGIFRRGCSVHYQQRPVGTVTSGGFSPMLKTSIALAYLPRAQAREGTAFAIDVRGKMVPCHSIKRPFYKPQRGAT